MKVPLQCSSQFIKSELCKLERVQHKNINKFSQDGQLLKSCMCPHMHSHSCSTLYDAMDYSPPGSSVHGIFQARMLERVAISSSRGSS